MHVSSEDRVVLREEKGLVPFEPQCLDYIHSSISKYVKVIHPTNLAEIQMGSYRINSDSDSESEGCVASCSLLPCRPCKSAEAQINLCMVAWVLRSETTTDRNVSDRASMDGDVDDDARRHMS